MSGTAFAADDGCPRMGDTDARDDAPTGRHAPSDARLVDEARAGSMTAFERLVERYQPRLLAFLAPYANHHAHDVEDLVQETFMRAYRHLEGYNPRWAFSTWLFRIAVRLAISEGRKRQRRARVVTADVRAVSLIASDPPPPACVIARDEREGLWGLAERSLPPEQYAMLWLTYVEQMSAREVGRAMGRTRAAVKVGVHRARRRLAEHLAESHEASSGNGSPRGGDALEAQQGPNA